MNIRHVLVVAAAILLAGALTSWASDGTFVDACFKVGGLNKGKVIVVGQEGLEPACPVGFRTLSLVTNPAAIDADETPTTQSFQLGTEAASISPVVGTYYLVHARLNMILEGIGANTAFCTLKLDGATPKTLDTAYIHLARHRHEAAVAAGSLMLEGWASADTTDRFVLRCDPMTPDSVAVPPMVGYDAKITLLPIASMNTLNPR